MNIALRLWAMVVVSVLGVFAQSSAKPDFSGTWQLDVQRSRFGEVPQPKALVIQIEHHEPQIRIVTITTTESGETRETLELAIDGKEHAQTMAGQPCTATARWDAWRGKRLIVEVNRQGHSFSRRFILGGKGRILTTILTVQGSSGDKRAYEFFVKR